MKSQGTINSVLNKLTEIFNQNTSKETRRKLRRNAPVTESIMWSKLRNNQLLDSKFRRQYSIGIYVVDFYCSQKRLAIEIDGDSHFTEQAVAYDKARECYIESLGITFLRFTNDEVMKNIDGVLIKIMRVLEQVSI